MTAAERLLSLSKLTGAASVLLLSIGSGVTAGDALNDYSSIDTGTAAQHLLSEKVVTDNGWLGGGGSLNKLDRRQTEEEKRLEREELGIIEKEITPIIAEKVRVKAKKENADSNSGEYLELLVYERLLDEEIARIRYELLLEKLNQRVISDNIASMIEESLNKRQAEIELQQFLEYQRIIEEDLIFVFSMLAEM